MRQVNGVKEKFQYHHDTELNGIMLQSVVSVRIDKKAKKRRKKK